MTPKRSNCYCLLLHVTLCVFQGGIYYPTTEGDSCKISPFVMECNKVKPGKLISCKYLNVSLPDKEVRLPNLPPEYFQYIVPSLR